MGLILRRLLASMINGLIVSVILTAISLNIVLILWFTNLRSSLNLKWFALFFAMTYSLLGSMWSVWLPRLGSSIARIQLQEIKPNTRRRMKIFARLMLYYSVPIILVFSYTTLLQKIGDDDPKMMVLLFAPLIFCTVFTLVIIPFSILVGKGKGYTMLFPALRSQK